MTTSEKMATIEYDIGEMYYDKDHKCNCKINDIHILNSKLADNTFIRYGVITESGEYVYQTKCGMEKINLKKEN